MTTPEKEHDPMIQKKLDQMQSQARPVAVDGRRLTPEQDEALNDLCRSVLTRGRGPELVEYLRSITVNDIMLPTATDAELRHKEGMRMLFGIIHMRALSEPKE